MVPSLHLTTSSSASGSVDGPGAGDLPEVETEALTLQEESEGLGDLLRMFLENHGGILVMAEIKETFKKLPQVMRTQVFQICSLKRNT